MPRLKQIQGASGRAELVLDADGPPDVQRIEHAGNEPLAVRQDRRDPEDRNIRGARVIHGWRRTWTIDRLHQSSPSLITEGHVRAATRLVNDFQMSEGAITGGKAPTEGEPLEPVEVRIIATQRYERAMVAIGIEGAVIVFRAAIQNEPLGVIAAAVGFNPSVLLGLLSASLTRLRDHYSPPAPVGSIAGLMPVVMDPALERQGRWRNA